MHITTPTITQIDAGKALVAWTGTDGLNAWIEVNGAFVFQDLAFADTARRKLVAVPDNGAPYALAVQEAAPGSELSPLCEAPTTEPTLRFDAVATAKNYEIYRRGPGDSAEAAQRSLPAEERRRRYAVGLYDALAHGWHHFRVESLDAYGRESTRAAWLYYAVGLPPYPETAVVTKAGGEHFLSIGNFTPPEYLPVYLEGLPVTLDGLPVVML